MKLSAWTKDITGQIFGRLTCIGPLEIRDNTTVWIFRCECGNRVHARSGQVKSGNTNSCGCYKRDRIRETHFTHGKSGTNEHRAWLKMVERCSNSRNPAYKNYGARGISVCPRWRGEKGFENYLNDLGPKPSPYHSVDRINNNGNYEPSNCRWATPREQCNNTRSNRKYEFNGKVKTIREWSDETGLKYQTINHRLWLGWSVGKALSTPVKTSNLKKA